MLSSDSLGERLLLLTPVRFGSPLHKLLAGVPVLPHPLLCQDKREDWISLLFCHTHNINRGCHLQQQRRKLLPTEQEVPGIEVTGAGERRDSPRSLCCALSTATFSFCLKLRLTGESAPPHLGSSTGRNERAGQAQPRQRWEGTELPSRA